MTEHIEWAAEESLALVLRIKNLPGTEHRVDPFQEAAPCWQQEPGAATQEQARRFYANTPRCNCRQFQLYGGCKHTVGN